ETEHDNLRTALEWCQAQEEGRDAGLRLVATLAWFWTMRNHFQEGKQWLEAALSRGSDAPLPLRVRALAGAVQLAWFGGARPRVGRLAEECLQQAREVGDEWVVAWALYLLAEAAVERFDFARAASLGQESLATARSAGDPWLTAMPLTVLGMAARFQGN